MRTSTVSAAVLVALASLVGACSGTGTSTSPAEAGGAGGSGGDAGGGGEASGEGGSGGDTGQGGAAGGLAVGGGTGNQFPDPTTCAEAASSASYLGCDYWPTVVDNMVQPLFDYAVVVANPNSDPAALTVTRGDTTIGMGSVPANGLVKIYLPWVDELKSTVSAPFKGCPTSLKTQTVRAVGGAYHLTTDRPVAVYQFNAIEYFAKGGPGNKDWSACMKDTCTMLGDKNCYSYTNDASLLLPTTALTGAYRIAGLPSWKNADPTTEDPNAGFTFPPYFAVTGTQDNTDVTVLLSASATISGGGGVASASGGGAVTFKLNRGDVVEVVGGSDKKNDFSGTLVRASAPVQVITGMGCTQNPQGTVACDHIEESVLPIETIGKHYFVAAPSAPKGGPAKYVVRLVGNVDGTTLTYPGVNPGGPATINAGELVDLGVVSTDFEIVGDREFTVSVFQVGATLLDPGAIGLDQKGDPSQSFIATVDQYRTKYIFLAPDDYDVSYVDVVQPMDAQLTLDGAPVTVAPVGISSGYGVARIQLGPGNGGAHTLTATKPVGAQVMGYGSYTSYQYPGGLNLGHISPVPIK
jgi:hypothetical protein